MTTSIASVAAARPEPTAFRMNVLLMGLRGCGQSTVGQLLAARPECPFLDRAAPVPATFAEPPVTAGLAAHGNSPCRGAAGAALGAVALPAIRRVQHKETRS